MLAALLLAGFTAAAVVPMMFNGEDDQDDAEPTSEPEDLPEASAAESSLLEGAIYEIPSNSSETILSQFDPSEDRVTLNVDGWDTGFEIEHLEGGGIALRVDAEGGGPTIVFPGLNELPLDAIEIAVQEDGSEMPTFVTLAEVFQADGDNEDDTDKDDDEVSPEAEIDPEPEAEEDLAEAEETDAAPLAPTEGDTQEDSSDGMLDEDELGPIGPIDPDLPDVPGLDLPIEEILDPTDPDAPEAPPLNDILDDVVEVVGDTADGVGTAAGLVYPGQPYVLPAIAPSEKLVIGMLGGETGLDAAVSVERTENGDTAVVIGGTPVVIVSGPDAITPEQVILAAPSAI